MKKILLIFTVLILSKANLFAQSSGYHVAGSFHIKSNDWWDYIAVNKNKLICVARHAGKYS